MKGRLVLAVFLILLAIGAISYEIGYLKSSSDKFTSQLDKVIDFLSLEEYNDAFTLYKSFVEDFFDCESILSVFIHDKAVDEIRDIIYETNAYFEKQQEHLKIDEIIRNLENIKMKIKDMYESMIPDMENLM